MGVSDLAPVGFELGLLEGWEIVPTTGSIDLQLGLSDQPTVLAQAHWRLADIERATGGEQLHARLRRIVDGSPVEAECSVSVYATDVDNDPVQIENELARTGESTDAVALPAGAAVRRTGRRPRAGQLPDRFVHQFFLPVPGSDSEIVFLEFWSPTLSAEGALRPQFEGIATSFEFTYGGTDAPSWPISETAVTPDPPDLQMGRVIRSTLTGWAGRFTLLAHLAVATWLAAALVVLSRVAGDVDKGLGAVVDDVFGAAFLGCFGVVGYVFDQYHGREAHLIWLVIGAVFLWAAITCPEGKLAYIC